MAPAARPISSFLFWKLWLNFVVQVSFEASKQQKPRAEWDLMVWESCSGLQNDIFYKRFQYASWLYLVCAVFICRCPSPIHAFKNFFQPYAINRPVLEMSSPLQRRRRIWRSCRTLADQRSALWSSLQSLGWNWLYFWCVTWTFIFGVTWLSWEQPHFRTGPFQSFKLLAVHGLHCLRSPITGRPGCKMLRNLELDHLCNWFLCALSLRVLGIWSVQTFS